MLDGLFRRESYPAGAPVFVQGDPANKIYVLLSGQVEIRFKPDDAETLTVAVLEAGGVFGWSAGLGRKEYTSGAICTQDTRLLSVEGAALRQLCEVRPETGVLILERLAKIIARRLDSTNQYIVEMLRQGLDIA